VLAARRADFDWKLLGNSSNLLFGIGVQSSFQYGPCNGPIHDAGVKKQKVQLLGGFVTDSALSRRRRAVDGDGVQRNVLTIEE
jgi:hypothetical protein